MNRASDCGEISRLVMSHIKPAVVTNNFMTRADYQREIENGDLFYSLSRDGIVLLRRRENFMVMNYTLHGSDLPALPEGADIVTEHVFRPGCDDHQVDFLGQYGFTALFDRMRMLRPEGDFPEISGNVRLAEIDEKSDARSVMAVLRACFDVKTGCLPGEDELYQDIKDGHVVVGCLDDGIVGVLHFSNHGAVSQLRHLAVLPNARRRGIAKAMADFYLNAIGGKKSVVWVRCENYGALQLYKSCGYSPDGWTSRVYEKGK